MVPPRSPVALHVFPPSLRFPGLRYLAKRMDRSLKGDAYLTHNSSRPLSEDPFRIALVTIYTIVLVGGSVGIGLMIRILKSNLRSITTIAVLNLLVVHLIFLLSVPFRIYYYISDIWNLTFSFCKIVGGLIHGHMYIAFLFYVIILVTRYHTFYARVDQLEVYRKLHAVAGSLVVWTVGLAVGLPVIGFTYGPKRNYTEMECFRFGKELKHSAATAVVNYLVSTVLITTAVALACCQVLILWRIFKQYGGDMLYRQEFGAQKKSLCFMLVVMLCFVPYHAFRLYYVSHTAYERENEVFLALTALSCLDTLIFLGRDTLCV